MRADVHTAYRGKLELSSLVDLSRKLRREGTDAESLLWSLLRNRQMAGAKFRRQHRFGQYILDFYCGEHKLVIELDGGQHTLPEVASRDAERSEYLEGKGNRVLRFTNVEVLWETDAVLQTIWLALGQPSP